MVTHKPRTESEQNKRVKTLKNERLSNGDHMKQPEFHAAYEAAEDDYRAELLGGVVFEPGSLGYEHGNRDVRLISLLEHYAGQTPGIGAASNATVILGHEDEVQPDVLLRIETECGGQSRTVGKKTLYLKGAPELVAETAHSSRAIDLHLKKERYTICGVREYIVFCLAPLELYWFNLRTKSSLPTGKDGIVRSEVFPGLWLHKKALLTMDYKASIKALDAGMQTAEYKAFATKLSSNS